MQQILAIRRILYNLITSILRTQNNLKNNIQ